ncbi:hypothetical protein [Fredinandcohnia onubensis]|uniref:hypothetical protein n=1 Tax=Fredinandcohnia onubensis TaxID=1571209 RepID=UPI000C0BC11C|nr:hypothetical protein [Fredinandcohnia onubensis]
MQAPFEVSKAVTGATSSQVLQGVTGPTGLQGIQGVTGTKCPNTGGQALVINILLHGITPKNIY